MVLRVDGKDVTPDQTLSFIVANIAPGTAHQPRDHPRRRSGARCRVTVGRRPSEEELAAQLFDPDERTCRRSGRGQDSQGTIAAVARRPGRAADPADRAPARRRGRHAGPGGHRRRPELRRRRQGPDRAGTIILSANGRAVAQRRRARGGRSRAAKADGREAVLLRVRAADGPPVLRADPAALSADPLRRGGAGAGSYCPARLVAPGRAVEEVVARRRRRRARREPAAGRAGRAAAPARAAAGPRLRPGTASRGARRDAAGSIRLPCSSM